MSSRLDRRGFALLAAAILALAVGLAPAGGADLARGADANSAASSDTLPTWRFTVEVGITQAVADYYGGRAASRRLVEAQLAAVGDRETAVESVRTQHDDGSWFIRYANFLVKASAQQTVGYEWMPLTDVQNRYFENPAATYLLIVQVT